MARWVWKLTVSIASAVLFLSQFEVIDWSSDGCGVQRNWIPQYEKLESGSMEILKRAAFFNQSGVYQFSHHECNGKRMVDHSGSYPLLLPMIFASFALMMVWSDFEEFNV
ncbi:MAG: hypothetical protein EOP45_17770 [Sphingobacteriaceae bacterium]|nr:MAG: hypothetical protein EOP45_17770 [Sphingobacteriaceae bacterium]